MNPPLHRRKAFRSSGGGFTEIADSEAGNWHQVSSESNREWVWNQWIKLSSLWDTEKHRDDTTFTAETSGNFDVKSTGTYLIIASMVSDRLGGSNRSGHMVNFRVNGTEYPINVSGFIRRANGHDSDETCGYAILKLTAGDDVQFYTNKMQSAGSDAYWTGPDNSNTTQNSTITIVRLNKNNPYCMLSNSSTANDHSLTADDTDTDQQWNDQDEIDTDYFDHNTSTDSDEITLKHAAKYLVCYSQHWTRATSDSTRTGVYERLQLDGSLIHGSYSNCYLRGSQSSEGIDTLSNCNLVLFETTSANQKLKLTAAREGGAITCDRDGQKSSIMIYMLHGNEKTFSIGSSTTERMGDTTGKVADFSSTNWIDSDFSLSSSQITVTGDKDVLCGAGGHCDGTAGDRVSPRWSLRVNATELLTGAGAGYIRNTADMYMASPSFANVGEPTNGQTLDVWDISTAADHSTVAHSVANTRRFWGIDLATL